MPVERKQVMVTTQKINPVWPVLAQVFDQTPDIRLFPPNPE
jgi:hypothetical protein